MALREREFFQFFEPVDVSSALAQRITVQKSYPENRLEMTYYDLILVGDAAIMLFGKLSNSKNHVSTNQTESSDKFDLPNRVVKIQSILKLNIGAGASVLTVLLIAAFFPNFLELIFGFNLQRVHIYLLIVIISLVITGSVYAIRIANQGNQKLAFYIALVFIYGSFYGSILVSPIGFHDPGLFFVSALMILASLYVDEKHLPYHTVIIIGIFVMAFFWNGLGLNRRNGPYQLGMSLRRLRPHSF